MLKFSGEKLNLSSGMASAASTISFSMVLISRSRVEAIVGGDCGDCCALGALAAATLVVRCPKAAAVKTSTANSKKIRFGFIGVRLLNWFEKFSRTVLPARVRRHQVVCAIVDDKLAVVLGAVLDGEQPDVGIVG